MDTEDYIMKFVIGTLYNVNLIYRCFGGIAPLFF